LPVKYISSSSVVKKRGMDLLQINAITFGSFQGKKEYDEIYK